MLCDEIYIYYFRSENDSYEAVYFDNTIKLLNA